MLNFCFQVGQILVHFITKNLLVLTSGIKLLVQIILRITLDSKIRSGSLSCLYSTLLTLICHRSREGFDLNEIASWLDLRSEHLLVRVEICRTITKSICSDLHEILIIKTISNVLESEDLPIRPPIQVIKFECLFIFFFGF